MIDFSNLSPEQLTGLSITLSLAHLFEIVEHTAERVVDKFKGHISRWIKTLSFPAWR